MPEVNNQGFVRRLAEGSDHDRVFRVDGPRILRRGEPRAECPPDTRLERRDPQVAPLVGVAAVPVQEQVHAPVAQIALAVKKDDRPRVVGREDLRHRRPELRRGPPPR